MQILVLSPHPDDEAIGCGGTLRAHRLAGDRIDVAFLTSGEAGGHGRAPDETRRLREIEAEAAAAVLGIHRLEFWRQPDGALRVTSDLIRRLSSALADSNPDLIYVPHPGEMHPDHRAAARLLRKALNGAAGPRVRTYEVWTPLQRLHEIIDISDHVEAKRSAIRSYRTQCEVMRFDEAALALNRYRGEMHSWPGGDYAEVFGRLAP